MFGFLAGIISFIVEVFGYLKAKLRAQTKQDKVELVAAKKEVEALKEERKEKEHVENLDDEDFLDYLDGKYGKRK